MKWEGLEETGWVRARERGWRIWEGQNEIAGFGESERVWLLNIVGLHPIKLNVHFTLSLSPDDTERCL